MNAISQSIRLKLIVIVAIAVLVSIVFATIASTWRETTRYSEAKRSEIEGTAFAFAAGVAEPLAQKNKPGVLKTLRAIGRIPGIIYVQVKDASGRKFAELGAAVVLNRSPDPGKGNKTQSPLDLLLGSNLKIETKIINGGVVIGHLNLLADTSDLRARLISGLWDALISAFLAMLLGIALTARLQRVITAPIRLLTTAMTDVRSTHDFSQRVEKSTQDETGTLVDTFNDMLDQIGIRDQRLAQHKDQLEITVDERTRDLKHAKNVAESANAAKSEFLATMSHEIRTPMNGMLVMSELLATAELSQRHRRYAEVIMRSGQSLLSIINDILDFSKIEAGHLELEQIPVDPSILIDDVLSLFWERAASKNLDLAAYIAPEVACLIEGDPVRINQVLSNLVNNALKFTETGHVFVSVRVEPETDAACETLRLRFSVRDTGIGIAGDKISTVFESFSQADQSTTRQYGGTGLGLAICKRLVAAMQGKIDLTSSLGEGSTFSFTMLTKALAPCVDISKPENCRLNSTAIILKNPGARIALENYLASYGIDAAVIDPANLPGEQVLDVNVIFADAEIVQELISQATEQPTAHQPTYVCISKLGDALAERLIRSGDAHDLLMLPIARTAVCELIQRLIVDQPLGIAAIENRTVPQTELPDYDGIKLLVADDSPVNREVIIEALSRMKISVHTVENGLEAVHAVEECAYDLVFMDCSMPVMDGFAATQKIRDAEKFHNSSRRLPIIALTAHVAGGPANEWQKSGMDDCLSKPFKIQTLITCFETWLPSVRLDQPTNTPASKAAENKPVATGDKPVEAVLVQTDDMSEDDVEIIDPQTLEAISEIDPGEAVQIFVRIFGLYESHAPDALARLEQSIDNGESISIAEAAHALKSLSSSIGASRVRRACDELEEHARNDELSGSVRQLATIRTELGQALEEITVLKNNNFSL